MRKENLETKKLEIKLDYIVNNYNSFGSGLEYKYDMALLVLKDKPKKAINRTEILEDSLKSTYGKKTTDYLMYDFEDTPIIRIDKGYKKIITSLFENATNGEKRLNNFLIIILLFQCI